MTSRLNVLAASLSSSSVRLRSGNAVVRGDVEHGSVMSGQIAGLVSKEETVEEILKDIYYGAAEVIQKEASRWAGVTRND